VAIVAILAAFLVNFTIISFLPFGRRPKCPDPVYHRDEKQGIEAPLGRREAAGIIESFRLTPELKVMEMWDPADYDSMWPLAWEHLIENTSVSNLPCGRGDSMPTTSQDMLASGFIYFKNLYFLNNTFFLVEQASATERTLHAEHWIKDWPGTARRNFGVSVVQGWEAVCNVTKSTDSVRHIERAIMITDFLPKYEPHLYHMLENMLGAWATLDHFLPADVERHTWPEFLILPQNNQQEFGIGGATISLIHAIFPRIRIMDEDRFTKISSVGSGVQLREVVASDRSGCDHGGVNQVNPSTLAISSCIHIFDPSTLNTTLNPNPNPKPDDRCDDSTPSQAHVEDGKSGLWKLPCALSSSTRTTNRDFRRPSNGWEQAS